MRNTRYKIQYVLRLLRASLSPAGVGYPVALFLSQSCILLFSRASNRHSSHHVEASVEQRSCRRHFVRAARALRDVFFSTVRPAFVNKNGNFATNRRGRLRNIAVLVPFPHQCMAVAAVESSSNGETLRIANNKF